MFEQTLPDRDLLFRAEKAAHNAWSEVITTSMPDAFHAERLMNALLHPFWRPMFELYLNDSVTDFGAQVLHSAGLADPCEIVVRSKRFRGELVFALYLNKEGVTIVEDMMENYRGHRWFDAMISSISSYPCRDMGQGVSLGPDHLATALENQDREILSRVVDPTDYTFKFEGTEKLPILSEAARLKTEDFWSPRYHGRTTAPVLSHRIEVGEAGWSMGASNEAFNLSIQIDRANGRLD